MPTAWSWVLQINSNSLRIVLNHSNSDRFELCRSVQIYKDLNRFKRFKHVYTYKTMIQIKSRRIVHFYTGSLKCLQIHTESCKVVKIHWDLEWIPQIKKYLSHADLYRFTKIRTNPHRFILFTYTVAINLYTVLHRVMHIGTYSHKFVQRWTQIYTEAFKIVQIPSDLYRFTEIRTN